MKPRDNLPRTPVHSFGDGFDHPVVHDAGPDCGLWPNCGCVGICWEENAPRGRFPTVIAFIFLVVACLPAAGYAALLYLTR